MKFIQDYKEGDRVFDIYLCKYKQAATTKNGKPYENVILQDKTGTIDAKVWEPNSMGIGEYEQLDYIEVYGEVTTFQGANQINVKRIRKCDEGEYDPANYLPVSSKNIEEMFTQLLAHINKIENVYIKKLMQSFFVEDKEFIEAFKKSSAAKSVHHGFVGGLLEHTLSVANLCEYYTKAYPILNKDLLISVAILHDIGKTKELSLFPENSYTDLGQLVGHLVIGSEMVAKKAEKIPDFPQRTLALMQHCILAHHGELEYGSPKKPAIIEAVALYYADDTDAKMQTFTEILNGTNETGWLGYNRLFESNLTATKL